MECKIIDEDDVLLITLGSGKRLRVPGTGCRTVLRWHANDPNSGVVVARCEEHDPCAMLVHVRYETVVVYRFAIKPDIVAALDAVKCKGELLVAEPLLWDHLRHRCKAITYYHGCATHDEYARTFRQLQGVGRRIEGDDPADDVTKTTLVMELKRPQKSNIATATDGAAHFNATASSCFYRFKHISNIANV